MGGTLRSIPRGLPSRTGSGLGGGEGLADGVLGAGWGKGAGYIDSPNSLSCFWQGTLTLACAPTPQCRLRASPSLESKPLFFRRGGGEEGSRPLQHELGERTQGSNCFSNAFIRLPLYVSACLSQALASPGSRAEAGGPSALSTAR